MSATTSIHGMWSTRLAFILAAAGSAVGRELSRLPQHRGRVRRRGLRDRLLLCVAAIGIPIMMAEILIGRRGCESLINTMRTLAQREGKTSAWSPLGWMGIVSGFLFLSFYSVIAGWTLAYVVRAAGGAFSGIDGRPPRPCSGGPTGDGERLLAWHTIFMVLTILVVARGWRAAWSRRWKPTTPLLHLLLVMVEAVRPPRPGTWGRRPAIRSRRISASSAITPGRRS